MPNSSDYLKHPSVKLVQEMMAIPGKSCEEGKIAAFITRKIKEAGVPASAIKHDRAHLKTDPRGEVGNMVVKIPGTVKGPRRLLMAHIDTVPLCEGCQPVIEGDYIRSADPTTALGADNRSGAAVLLQTLLTIKEKKLDHPPLTFYWPIQEELGLRGIRHLSTSLLANPKLCFNWDGRDPNMLIQGATGDIHIQIEIEGIASHAGVHPEEGVNAGAIASLAIADLVQNGWHGLVQKGNQSGTSNIGIVNGGNATNVVMPSMTLVAEARSHNPKFRERIVKAYHKAFEKAARELTNTRGERGKVTFETYLKYESFKLKATEPAMVAAKQGIKQLGMEPYYAIANGGLDANWMTQYGFPTVTLGAGQENVHTVRERLHIPSFLSACELGLILATGPST